MADNVAITAGAGTTVSTDQVTIAGSSVHVQHVKILGAQDNSTARLAVSSTTGGITVNNATAANLSATVVQGTAASLNATVVQATASSFNAQVVGSVASAATDSGNPVKIGGKARTANPTAVTDGQRVDAGFDKLGRQIVVNEQARDLRAFQYTTLNTTAETTIITAGAAGVFNDLTFLSISNVGATAANATIKDATGGTTRLVQRAANVSNTISPIGPVAMPQTTSANNWTITMSAKSTVHVLGVYVKNL